MKITRKTLSIDFGSKEIKVIEGKYTKQNIQILKAITIETPSDTYINGTILNKDALATVIRDKLDENKIKTVTAHVVINSSQILTREIIIPKVSNEEIKSVVNYQVADYLPINIDDYTVEYLAQGNIFEDDMEKIKILLLAIPKDMVFSHLELLESAGLRPVILDYQGNSVAKLLEFNDNINEKYPVEDLAIASIDMGYHNSKIMITKNGNIEIARIIDFGSQKLYDNITSFFEYSAEKIAEELRNIDGLSTSHDEFSDEARFNNIVRSSFTDFCEKVEAIFRHYNTREVGNVLDCILLQGGMSNIPEIDQVFSAYFNISTMQLSTLDRIRWDGDLSKYASAIGGLIRMDVK